MEAGKMPQSVHGASLRGSLRFAPVEMTVVGFGGGKKQVLGFAQDDREGGAWSWPG